MSLRRQKPFRRGLQNTFPNRSLVALTASMENMITASHTKIYMPQQASLEYRGV